MKAPYLTIAVLLGLSTLTSGCSGSGGEIVNPPTGISLISNGSFEFNRLPSLQGWTANVADTSYVNFSPSTPPDGGSYSVRLRNEWSFPGSIEYSVVSAPGTHRYRLHAWARAVLTGALRAGGEMSILLDSSGNTTIRKSWHFADTTWTDAGLLDTLTTGTKDTVLIRLRGNIDQFSNGYVLFDLCTFEQLD